MERVLCPAHRFGPMMGEMVKVRVDHLPDSVGKEINRPALS